MDGRPRLLFAVAETRVPATNNLNEQSAQPQGGALRRWVLSWPAATEPSLAVKAIVVVKVALGRSSRSD